MFHLDPQEPITESDERRAQRLLIADGAFAQSMTVMTGGPVLVAFALLLGASNFVIGILAAIGPMAQILQIPSIYLVERTRKRKMLVFWSATISRLLFAVVAFAPWIAPDPYRLPLFIAALAMHFAIGSLANCAFMSWVRDVVPQDAISDFFSKRLALASFVGAVLSLMVGMGIDGYQHLTGDPLGAYTILYLLGAILGIASVAVIIRVPEPVMPTDSDSHILQVLREPFRDKRFRDLLIFTGAWNFAVLFAAPFFGVYLIDRLGLSMSLVLGLSVLSQIFNVICYRIWNRLGEAHSDKAVLTLAVPMFFVTLLMWPFTTMPEAYFLTLPLLVLIHALAGMSTAGVALCAGNLALKFAPYGRATAYLAVNALVAGIASVVAPVLAGIAADGFAPYELKLSLAWIHVPSGDVNVEFPTFDLRGLDFVFIIAFILGLYAIHRLLAIREAGQVREAVVRREFFMEMRRMARQVSTVDGLRQLTYIPFAAIRDVTQKRYRQWQSTDEPPPPPPPQSEFKEPRGPM